MGMIRIEVIRPTDRARARLKAGFPVDAEYADDPQYISRAAFAWNTRSILFVRPVVAELDLPGAQSVIVTGLGEFATPEPQWELAARIHEADERGVDVEMCRACGSLEPETNSNNFCRDCG